MLTITALKSKKNINFLYRKEKKLPVFFSMSSFAMDLTKKIFLIFFIINLTGNFIKGQELQYFGKYYVKFDGFYSYIEHSRVGEQQCVAFPEVETKISAWSKEDSIEFEGPHPYGRDCKWTCLDFTQSKNASGFCQIEDISQFFLYINFDYDYTPTYYLKIPYIKGQYNFTGSLVKSKISPEGCQTFVYDYVSITVDDPIDISLKSRTDSITGLLQFNYGPFHDNGKGGITLQCTGDYELGSIGVSTTTHWVDIPTGTLDPAGGTISLNDLSSYLNVYCDDWYTNGVTFRIKKTMEDPSNTAGCGNNITLHFYDRPKISLPTGGLPCVGAPIKLKGGYQHLDCSNSNNSPNAKLEAQLASSDINSEWYPFNTDIRLTNVDQDIYFSDITTDQSWAGKEIRIRPYLDYNSKKTGAFLPGIVFLAIPNTVITPTPPKCSTSTDGGFNIGFPDIPPLTQIPLKIDVYNKNDQNDAKTLMKTTSTNSINITSADLSGLPLTPGDYNVTILVNDGGNWCPAVKDFTIPDAPHLFSATAEAIKIHTNPDYHIVTEDNSGQVKFIFTGGTYPYYITEGANITAINSGNLNGSGEYFMNVTTSMIPGQTTEEHIYYLSDKNTCPGSEDKPVTFIRPPDISITANGTPKNIKCHSGDGDISGGEVSWAISGGLPPYSLNIFRNTVTTPFGSRTNKTAGDTVTFKGALITQDSYHIEVNDALNTALNKPGLTLTVGTPDPLALIVAATKNNDCFGDNKGAFTLAPSGGNSGYSYLFTKTEDNSTPANGYLPVGTYNIAMSDINGCTFNLNSLPISQPSNPLTLDATYSQPASCPTIANGKVKAIVSNFRNSDTDVTFKMGTTTLSKTYDAGNNCFYLNNLSNTNNSNITVTDAFCQANDTVLIPLLNPQFYASATVKPSDLAPCTGKNGIITLTSINCEGTGFNYSVDGSPFSAASGITKKLLLKGNTKHTINVTDGLSGCPFSLPIINVDVRPDSLKLNPLVATTPAWCTTSNSGQANVSALSGWGTLNFKISSKDSTATGIFLNLLPTSYKVVAKDDSLCTSSVSFQIPVSNDSLNLSVTNTIRAACKGESYTGELKASRLIAGKKTGFGSVSYSLNAIPMPDSIFSSLKSGLYTVAAVDGKNCHATIKDSVKFDTNPVTFTIDSLKDQRCNEVQNAKLYLKAHTSKGSNQTFRFAYAGDTTAWHADTMSYFVKTAGTYKFDVIDRNNCGTNLNHTIQNLHYAPKPTLDLSSPVACANATNGYLSIYNTPNNSIPKYKYQLGANTKYAGSSGEKIIFPGLVKGYHIITATDTLGCQDTAKFVVNVRTDSLLISRIDTTSATCIAAQNGKAKIVASSFDKNVVANKYTFLCNGSTLLGDSVTFVMLPVKKTGTYPVRVTDQYGCLDTKTFVMNVRKDTLNLWQRAVVNASCPDSSSGIFTVRRVNGASSYRFQVTSIPVGFSRTFYSNDTLVPVTKLPQGNYRIAVKDTNNCYAFVNNIPITQPQPINFFNYSQNYIKHKGQPEGQMSASIQLGNRKYNYEWLKLSDHSLITSGKAVEFANIQLNNRLAGDYLLRVRDTANCFVGTSGWLEKQFNIVEPAQDLVLNLKRMRRVSCFGLHDGEFELKATGGWGNQYKYGFDAINLFADSVFSNRSIESVTMFAKDTSGVTASLLVSVTQPSVLTASLASKADANCFGSSDGKVTVNIAGGNDPKYFISPDNTQWTLGNSLSGLSKGDYTIHVRDSLNCNTAVAVSIDQPTEIIRNSYRITDTRCGFSNGIITAKISGGIPGYTYQWYKGTNPLLFATDSAYNLFSGSYRLSVTDLHNCSSSFPFNVSDITDLTIDTIYTQPVTCWGYSDGKASTLLSKGNPPYIITWPDSTHLMSVAGLKTGNYSLWVTDQEKCNVYRDFSIGTPLNIYLSTKTITDPLCEGVNDGALNMEAAGSFSGFNYLWNTGSTKNSIKNLTPGNYSLTVTDDHTCSNLFNFTLKYQQAIKPKLGADLTLCKGNTFRLNPGIFSDYKWTSSVGFASRLSEVSVDKPGNYFVEVMDNDGCVGRDTIKIDQSVTDLQGKLLLATNVEQNDTVVIFEASWPIPDSVKFQLNGCKVLTSGTYYREVVFADTGTYTIGLTSYLNDCLDMVSKDIKVEPKSFSQLKSASAKLIQSYQVSPNPSSGQFLAEITLREDATIYLKLANLATGVITDVREYKGNNTYNISYSLNNLTPGTYILHLQAGKEAKSKTIIIMK